MLYAKSLEDAPVPTGMMVMLIPFVLIGAALTFYGIRELIRLARYGGWILEVPDGGGISAGFVDVTLIPRRRTVTPQGELTCRLRCRHTQVYSQQPRGAHTTPDRAVDRVEHVTLWDKSWTVPPALIDRRSGMTLRVFVPPDIAPTQVNSRDGSGVTWQLNVLVPADGITHEAMFDLPVSAAVTPSLTFRRMRTDASGAAGRDRLAEAHRVGDARDWPLWISSARLRSRNRERASARLRRQPSPTFMSEGWLAALDHFRNWLFRGAASIGLFSKIVVFRAVSGSARPDSRRVPGPGSHCGSFVRRRPSDSRSCRIAQSLLQ